MAAPEILMSNLKAGYPNKKIVPKLYQENIRPIYEQLASVKITEKFDPKVHLSFQAESVSTTKRLTMAELGIFSETAISDIGVSDPFDLFTEEAVEIMRAEILRTEVFEKWARYSYSSTTGLDCVIRGYAKYTCPFTYAAWTHPETVKAVSLMAGVELQVIMDYEVAHINIAMKSKEDADNQIIEAKRKSNMNDEYDDKIPAVVGWHNDSYPFVCVLMLSDTTAMIGGETLLKMGNGKIVPTPGPSKGKAVILQGREISHLAPIPLGYTERITAVTSYRAKDATKPDMSVLSTVKPEISFGSMYNEFYPEWIEYRMNLIKERCDLLTTKVNSDLKAGKTFAKDDAMKTLKEMDAYLHKTWKEMEVTPEEYARMLAKQ
ncbi:unnamed protein product [Kuraishia capsulata CBS 1993]|uniref:Fe2OG dioxygenase domain-containing protein n=1 Tax=Kuraishia capsulata CBS 1993 TaxID=1382522 RepID=W6MHP3_9ASCO|nr:uncharacterized protein KUCA_T00001471001 [Kuraishia capsulata CBS 1993]CDK25501.1 unnamed protein product [Kuraishia capsulata CBS 1993]